MTIICPAAYHDNNAADPKSNNFKRLSDAEKADVLSVRHPLGAFDRFRDRLWGGDHNIKLAVRSLNQNPFRLDSGAFAVWYANQQNAKKPAKEKRRVTPPTNATYSRFIKEYRHRIAVDNNGNLMAFSIDVIDDPERGEGTNRNHEEMKVEHGLHLIPTFHSGSKNGPGDRWYWLDKYASEEPWLAFSCKEFGHEMELFDRWMNRIVSRSSRPPRLHFLGVTEEEVLRQLHPDSCDSKTWLDKGNMFKIQTRCLGEINMRNPRDENDSEARRFEFLGAAEKKAVEEELEGRGYELGRLRSRQGYLSCRAWNLGYYVRLEAELQQASSPWCANPAKPVEEPIETQPQLI